MMLRLGCDLDGTLADMDAALQREADQLFGPGIDITGALPEAEQPQEGDGSRTPISPQQLDALWKHVRGIPDFWLSLEESEPHGVARLAAAASVGRWQVIFLTQRPSTAGDTAQIQSQRWLDARGFRLPSVYVGGATRGRIAAALQLDAIIDDRPENVLDVVAQSETTRPLLMWRDRGTPPPGAARMGIEVVSSLGEALKVVASMRQDPPAAQGFLTKMRSLIPRSSA